jgi:hypothetical protein
MRHKLPWLDLFANSGRSIEISFVGAREARRLKRCQLLAPRGAQNHPEGIFLILWLIFIVNSPG